MVLELQVLSASASSAFGDLATAGVLAAGALEPTLTYLVLVTLAVLLLALLSLNSSLFVYLSLEAGCRFIDCYICASASIYFARTGLNFDRVLRRVA